MNYEQIGIIVMIAISTIMTVIGTLKGNTDTVAKAEKTRQKALKKLQKKHVKTLETCVKEEKKIEELTSNGK